MRVDGNGGSEPNYYPNSFDDIYADKNYKQPPLTLDSALADWYDRNASGDDDHYTQPGWLFNKVMSAQDKKNLINNIVASMKGITGPKREEIINRQISHFSRADTNLGLGVAKGLGVEIQEKVMSLA